MQNDHAPNLEGSNAKINITMLFSSSSYPKIIYGMPLFAKVGQNRFEFEFKFKFELNQKENGKKEKEKKRRRPDGLASGEQAQLSDPGPSELSPRDRDE